MEFSGAASAPETVNLMNRLDGDYGWVATNIAGAWQWTGGHSLIGVIDSGLATEHPDLMSFDEQGEFVGGNFLPVYSLDIGRWPDALDYNVDEL
jgi:serine protease